MMFLCDATFNSGNACRPICISRIIKTASANCWANLYEYILRIISTHKGSPKRDILQKLLI